MKTLITCFVSIMFCSLLFGQQQQQQQQEKPQIKAVLKTVPIKFSTSVDLQVKGSVKVKYWDRAFVRVYTNVKVYHNFQNLYKKLVTLGRYSYAEQYRGKKLSISFPSLNDVVLLNGLPHYEEIFYTVYLPNDIEFNTSGELVADEENNASHQVR